MATLKQGVSVKGKNITLDPTKIPLGNDQKAKLQNAGYTINEPTTPTVTPQVTPTATPPVAPREYMSPKLQERINKVQNASPAWVTPPPVTDTQIANAPIDTTTGAPQLPEQPKPQIKPLEATKPVPTVPTQAEAPKDTLEVPQNKAIMTENKQKFDETQNQKVLADFQSVLQNDSKDPRLNSMITQNPALRDQMRSISTNYLKQQRAQKLVSSLSLKTASDLTWAVESQSILPWTEDWETLSQSNPQLVQEYNQKKKTDTTLSLINGTYSVDPFDPKKQSWALLQKISEMQNSQNSLAMYDQFMSAPEIQNTSAQILWVDQELITVSEQIQGIDDSVRSTLPAWVPESIIAWEVANRQKGLYQKVTALESRKQALIENYNRVSEQAIQRFQVYQQDQSRKLDFMQTVYGIARQEEVRYEDLQRADQEYARAIERSDYEYERAIEREDYTTARNIEIQRAQLQEERGYNEQIAMENQLLSMWVDPTGMDKQTMYATVSRAVQEQNMQQAYLAQQDADIKAYNAQKGNWKIQDWYMVNSDTGEYAPLSQAQTPTWQLDMNVVLSSYSQKGQELLSVPDGTVVPTRLSEVSAQNAKIRGKECAEYVNDITGAGLGSTYASKLAVCDEPNGVVWSVASWKPNGSGEYGHTGIIVWEDWDSWIIKSSNLKPWTITTDRIPKSVIGWYYTPPKVAEMYNQVKIPEAQKDILDGIDTLLSHKWLNNAVWFWAQKLWFWDRSESWFIPATEAENFRTQFNSFRDNIVLPNLDKLKWAMSDNDIKFIRNASTSLSLWMSEKAFKAELERIKNKIYERFWWQQNSDPLGYGLWQTTAQEDPLGIR